MIPEADPSSEALAKEDLSRVEYPDDAAWERSLADPRPMPKLESFLRESAAEGDEPLDASRL